MDGKNRCVVCGTRAAEKHILCTQCRKKYKGENSITNIRKRAVMGFLDECKRGSRPDFLEYAARAYDSPEKFWGRIKSYCRYRKDSVHPPHRSQFVVPRGYDVGLRGVRSYPEEFRVRAAEFADRYGVKVAAESYGLSRQGVYRWHKLYGRASRA